MSYNEEKIKQCNETVERLQSLVNVMGHDFDESEIVFGAVEKISAIIEECENELEKFRNGDY